MILLPAPPASQEQSQDHTDNVQDIAGDAANNWHMQDIIIIHHPQPGKAHLPTRCFQQYDKSWVKFGPWREAILFFKSSL